MQRRGGGGAWLQTCAFTAADVERRVSLANGRVKVWTGAEDADGKVRAVRWEAPAPNCDGRIVRVDARLGGRGAVGVGGRRGVGGGRRGVSGGWLDE